MRKPVKAAPKHHPVVKHPHIVEKAPEKAEKPVHIAIKESGENEKPADPERFPSHAAKSGKTNNKELIDGLKRAKQQIWQFHFRNDEAVQATKWIDELIDKAS